MLHFTDCFVVEQKLHINKSVLNRHCFEETLLKTDLAGRYWKNYYFGHTKCTLKTKQKYTLLESGINYQIVIREEESYLEVSFILTWEWLSGINNARSVAEQAHPVQKSYIRKILCPSHRGYIIRSLQHTWNRALCSSVLKAPENLLKWRIGGTEEAS